MFHRPWPWGVPLRTSCTSSSHAIVAETMPSGRRPRRHRSLLLASLSVVALAHCDQVDGTPLHAVLEGVGVADAPQGEPLDVHVLCDPSEGSPCGSGTAALLVERVARAAFHHPGTDLSVHLQGERPADTRRLATITVPPAVDRGERAAKVAEDRFVASVRAAVCPPLDATVTIERPRQSPIVEAIDEIALSRHAERPVVIFALTDLREVSSLGDLECDRTLPSIAAFQARLRRRGLLQRGALARVELHVVTGDHGAVPRRHCPVSMGRERELQTLWSTVLLAAGATRVTFRPDVPAPDAIASLLPTTNHPAVDAGTAPRRTR